MNIELLDRLKQAGGFMPIAEPGDLADLAELEAFGFQFDRHPDQNVSYRGPASRLCPDQIEWELNTRVIGRRIAVWNRVASTMDLAARAAASVSNHGLVILAEEQSSGRGSRGRSWSSPAGSSILMSVLLFPPIPLQDPAWLTAFAAVAVARAVAGLGLETGGEPLAARIKWPNDIRVEGRKLAGILVERGQGTVIGIGLNVNTEEGEFPADLRDSATSLRRLLGRPIDRSELVQSIVRNLDHHFDGSIVYGPDDLGGHYGRYSEHLWHEVDVSTPNGIVGGRLGRLDLRMGLEVGTAHDDCVAIPIRDVLGIVNWPGSRQWTWEERDLQWFHCSPDELRPFGFKSKAGPSTDPEDRTQPRGREG